MKIVQIQKVKMAFISISLLAITSCSVSVGYTKNDNHFIKRIVKEETLKNGQFLRIGYKEPDANAGCKYLSTQAVKMFKAKLSFNLGGDYGILSDAAVDYANQHPLDKINYAYLKVPNEIHSGSVSVPTDDYKVSYYSCKNPPIKHSNPFKD